MNINNNRRRLKLVAPKIFNILNLYYPLDGLCDEIELFKRKKNIDKINQLINQNIIDENSFNINWVNGFCNKVENELQKPVISASFGSSPNYGGYIILEKRGDCYSELHFYISFIEHVYSIQIAITKVDTEKREYLINKKNNSFRIAKALIVSPVHGFFKNEFNTIENLIKMEYKKGVFLPYRIDQMRLIELKETTNGFMNFNNYLGSVFFNKFIAKSKITKTPKIIGNINYKLNELK